MAFYVLDENNNKVEAFDKQGVLSVLEQAISEGTLANIVSDSAFVSKLKCCVGGTTNHIAFVSQAQYNELKESELLIPNCYYFITDDTTAEDLDEQLKLANESITSLDTRLTSVESKFNGDKAKNAVNADNADFATNATYAQNATKATTTDMSNADFVSVQVYESYDNVDGTKTAKFYSDEIDCPNFSVPQLMYIETEHGDTMEVGTITNKQTATIDTMDDIVNLGVVNIPQVDSLNPTTREITATGIRHIDFSEGTLIRRCLEILKLGIRVEIESGSINTRIYSFRLEKFRIYDQTYYDDSHPHEIFNWCGHEEGEKFYLKFKPIR